MKIWLKRGTNFHHNTKTIDSIIVKMSVQMYFFLVLDTPWGQSSVVGGLKWWLSRGCKRPFHREAQTWVKQYSAYPSSNTGSPSQQSEHRPHFCWGLAISFLDT